MSNGWHYAADGSATYWERLGDTLVPVVTTLRHRENIERSRAIASLYVDLRRQHLASRGVR